ncbi:MAG: 2-hydroxyhepta-2,4-diene-1,7-dioate isomerase [Planctomycetaceae bacterium]|nr:2-hydroxyhepta-2,4-diene-1,7-dioate isomerase [Planctomycetaceae bacterium]HAA69487.1 2-hydroxyhepta-2,4-diene-1,7-dioate isomerase [Planctomycetaceae bacterium]|tara:strand:+ start:22564 stop:23421 length:858 start_codon:yes stop_codon:yes gene_type:complete
MKLARFKDGQGDVAVGIIRDDQLFPLDTSNSQYRQLSDILEADDPAAAVAALPAAETGIPLEQVVLLPPIDNQEVWAAGVTYKRSQTARMEESETSADCYDRVYQSARPEIFLKATPNRVSGPGEPVRIRADSKWDVPEPELALVMNSRLELVGFTIGNDVSSRDIEGENPLYLPQAKVYNQCCGLGPYIVLASSVADPSALEISLSIERDGNSAFQGETSISEMARSFDDLLGWLGRENSFPNGAFLLTGTGIVPDSDFTLQDGDLVHISISGIGTLSNPVVRG